MFGLFKKLFGKAPAPAPSLASVATQASASAPKLAPPPPPAVRGEANATAPITPAFVPPLGNTNYQNGGVRISVSAILPALPEGVRSRLALQQNESVVIPRERLLPQLATGAVSLPFAELQELAPELFQGICNHDTVVVNLPLADVLKQLTPADFPRRPGQRKIEVPEEVTGLFGEKGQRITISGTVLKEEPRLRPPLPSPNFPSAPAPTPSVAPPAPAPLPSAAPIRLAPLSTVPLPSAAPIRAPSLTPAAPPPPAPAPALPAATLVQAAGSHDSPFGGATVLSPPAPVCGDRNVAAPRGMVVEQAREAKETCPAPTASSHSPGAVLRVPLAQAAASWPDEVRRDLAGLNLATAAIELPMTTAEQALKSGLVAFPWKQLCQWIDSPSVLAPPPATGEMLVEVPLPIIAPLFMARYRPAATQKRAAVSDSIPDLFGKDKKQAWQPPAPMFYPARGECCRCSPCLLRQ